MPRVFAFQTAGIMRLTALAMLPAVLASAHLRGAGVFLQILLAVCAALAAEYLCLRLRGLPAGALKDGSAAVAGIVVGVSLPPFAPWFVAVFAAVCAMALAKHCFGGLGNNVFNPAMAGYALAFVSFPAHFEGWISDAQVVQTVFGGADALSSPTPLSAAKIPGGANGSGGGVDFVFPIACAAGGTVLLALRIADWRLTSGFLLAAFAAAFLCGDLETVLHGGLVFAAFFVVTDPATAAANPRGRWLYAAAAGALTVWLRREGAHADSIAFAILIANMLAPLCDKLADAFRR